jgi:hypothetical protein
MKKILLFLVASFVVISSFAQTNIPQLVSFSAVVRDANNLPLANTPVSIRLTFKQGGQNGPLVYCALHQNTTNQNGFISIQLNRDVLGTGCNGAPLVFFESIPWENGGFWMEVEYQTIPGSPFVNLGQLELASSFYAFAAGTAERITSITTAGAQNGDILVYNSTTGKFEPGQSGITSVQWANVQNKPNFATVAISGSYNDLTNQPTLFDGNYQSLTNLPTLNIADWNTAFAWGNHVGLYRPLSYVPTWSEVTNKPNFATVASSGSYNDLTNQPTLFDGNYQSLTNLPTLNIADWNTAFAWGNHAGLYRPLSYVPTWSEVTNKPNFATVATSGSYNDLTNKPNITDTLSSKAVLLIGDQTVSGNKTYTGILTSESFVKTGGTSSQFLKADGSVDNNAYSVVREVNDEFVSTASQTSFTLTQTPNTKSRIKMYINGIRISNSAYSLSGTTLTYSPINNGSYNLSIGDRIQIEYYY